jgi:WD40 repeat protein
MHQYFCQNKRYDDGSDRIGTFHQKAIVTTLGNGLIAGRLYLICVLKGCQLYNLEPQLEVAEILTTNESVWTSESCPGGRLASLGTSSGPRIVDLEQMGPSRLFHSSSDVLSQQFESSGNVLLSGFRNGVISTIDLRLPLPQSCATRRRGALRFDNGRGRRRQGRGQRDLGLDKYYCSHSRTMQMNSAVCSLKLLRSCEWYLLASAMNGDIQQWDRRFVEKGAVRTYEGHCNSHTMLQLGVDPTERLFASGGEDSVVRIWSLASGRLLQETGGLNSPVTTISWPNIFTDDNPWSMWMGSSSGLLRMTGAA